MFELFIENQQVDVDEGFSTLLTLAVDDIRDFGSRNTTFSKTIILPGTKRNNLHFGNVYKVTRSTQYAPGAPNYGYNFNAAVGAKAIIYSDNVQIFKGVAHLLEIIIDGSIEYEIAVFGELGGLVSAMGAKKLEDLDFSAYDTTYSLANITASWTAAPGAGLYFPLMDYGTYSTDKKNWSYRTFRPALHAKEYIDKIFASAGYTYDCVLFNTDRFKRHIIPHNQKALTKISSIGLDVNQGTSTPQTFSEALPFDTLFYPTAVVLGSFTTSDNASFTYAGTATLRGKIRLHIAGEVIAVASIPPQVDCGASVYILPSGGGSSIYSAATYFPVATLINETVVVNDVMLNTGDVIQSAVFGNADIPYNIRIDSCRIEFESYANIPVQINLGEALKINDCIPKNILQKDFFSSIIKLYNLYVTEDKASSKKLIISPFVDFYNLLPSDAWDWTDKVDLSQPMRIKPMSELNARYYEFKYAGDSDYYNDLYKKRYNENYGDMIFDSEFEFAEEKKTTTIIFSGTPLVGYPGEAKVYSTIFKQNNNVEECVDSTIRILQRKRITGVPSWDIKNGAAVLGSYTDYPYAGHLDDPDAPANDLNFGTPKELFFTLTTGALNVNQFNVYYSTYMAEITDKDSKLLTVSVRLTKKDVADLNFARWVWLAGSLFRLNKIIDFNASSNETCKAELLKVINTVY